MTFRKGIEALRTRDNAGARVPHLHHLSMTYSQLFGENPLQQMWVALLYQEREAHLHLHVQPRTKGEERWSTYRKRTHKKHCDGYYNHCVARTKFIDNG